MQTKKRQRFRILEPLRILLPGLCMILSTASAQLPGKQMQKLSPLLRTTDSLRKDTRSQFLVVVNPETDFTNWLQRLPVYARIRLHYENSSLFIIETAESTIRDYFLPSDHVLFVDRLRVPREELQVNGFDISANKINQVHAKWPQYNGSGLMLSVKENRMDTADIDFKGRYLSTGLSSPVYSPHASFMATIAAGGGNSYYLGKGAAWGSGISSSSFANLLPDANSAYQLYNISVQNHSYGTGIENYYGADAAAYDASTIANPSLIHVFSAGNSGASTASTGSYSGITGYANLTGSFKMSKNSISVGATDSFGVVAALSSKGPAHDGRIKPELIAFGQDGSSGAAALVSGTALLLQHVFAAASGNQLPSSSLVKAILINSADDAGRPGIDFKTGYGNLNATKAMDGMLSGNWLAGAVSNGGVQEIDLSIPSGIKKIKLTLVWNDPQATANASRALVNDLDLELNYPATGQSWQPWVLNHFPHVDSLALLPSNGRDSLNNVEHLTMENPSEGNYIVRVRGFNVSGSQEFYVAYQFDTADRFTWYSPAVTDNVFPGRANAIRWESTYAGPTGKLEFTKTNGADWQPVDANVDLGKGYYQWLPPAGLSTARLRMTIGSASFLSDEFTISERLDLEVGFHCPDSFMFFWQPVPHAQAYQLYKLGDNYLEALATTSDTIIVLSKTANAPLHYAIAPIFGGRPALKSYTIDYTTQGVDCYFRNFFAQLINGEQGELTLGIGTVYNIRYIIWEKKNLSGFVSIDTVSLLQGISYRYVDHSLTRGVNSYRVRIVLNNGQSLYSQPETIYFLGGSGYIVYPNPAKPGEEVNIITSDVEDAVISVFSSSGLLVYERILDDTRVTIPANKLRRGVYLIRITGSAGSEVLKLVVI